LRRAAHWGKVAGNTAVRGNPLQTMSSISRRTFLAGSSAILAGPALAGPAASETETIIVGAGAAGIAAARRLAAANRRCIVIEAADRVGGRCITDTRLFGVPFDLGAHWIYASDVNPVTKAPRPAGLEIYPAPPGQRVRIGRRNAREGELEDFLSNIVRANRAIGDAARGKVDMHCGQALPKDLGDWKPTIEFLLGPYNTSADLNEVSAMDLGRATDRDNNAFCRQGFGALLAGHATGLPVRLSTPVTQVDTWSKAGGVEVRTAKGSVRGRFVIVTVSTAVLSSGKITFSPELPKRQVDALARLKLGSFDHIALELGGNPFGLQRDDLVFEKAAGTQTGALLANIGGSSLATVSVGGKFGRELSAKGEKEMIDFAVGWLTGLYGSDVGKAVKRSHATRWNASPFVLGASSFATPGGQPARRTMMEPVRDRLYFAGEAIHETQFGTVGGAWESGERAAEAVLRKLGVLKAPVEQKPRPETPRRRRRDKS
jgi:monoamine oxidase